MEWQDFLEKSNVRPYRQELEQILDKRYSSKKDKLKSILLELEREQQYLDLELLILALALQNYPTPPKLLTRRQRQQRGIELDATQTKTKTRTKSDLRRDHLLTLLNKKIYEHPKLRRCHTKREESPENYNQAWYETQLYISRHIAEEYDPLKGNGLLIIWVNCILSPKVNQDMKTQGRKAANQPPEDSLDAPTNNGKPREVSDNKGDRSLSDLVYECVYNDEKRIFASRVQYPQKIKKLIEHLTYPPKILLLDKTQKILNNIDKIVAKDDKETVDFLKEIDEIAKEFNLEIYLTFICLLIIKLNLVFGITWKEAFLCKLGGGNIKALAQSKGIPEQNVYSFINRQLCEGQNPLRLIIRECLEN
ncbi:MAG: hypothetical protein AB4372_39685 [Xenococcus sp. (in: cyanobacteria)]